MVDPPHTAPAPVAAPRGGEPAMPGQSTIFDLIQCDEEYFSQLSSVCSSSAAERAAERLRLVARLR